MDIEKQRDCVSNFATAITNISLECMRAGVTAPIMAESIGKALRQVLTLYAEPEQASAFLKIEAAKLDAIVAPARGQTTDITEMMQLGRQTQTYIDTLVVAGVGEREAVTSIVNAATVRVARMVGAKGAAEWLRRLANRADENEAAINELARFA